MTTELEDVYMTMITESSKTGTVEGTKVKPGEGFEGSEKAKKMSTESGPEGKENKVDKPVAGPSVGDASFEEGKGKPLSKKEGKVKEATEEKDKVVLTFDDLYNKTINEEEEAVVPAPDVEGEDFSEKEGDFGAEGSDVEEEIDVASELRLLADRLTEIADKLSVDEAGEGEAGLEEGPVEEIPPAVEGEEVIGKESVQNKEVPVKEAIVSEPTPTPLKKTTMNPKMSQNPKNKIGKSGASKASMPKGKDHTGEISPCPKTTLGPKMSQNPSGTGPAVKGGNAPLVA